MAAPRRLFLFRRASPGQAYEEVSIRCSVVENSVWLTCNLIQGLSMRLCTG
jgi:hypothetical protein